MDVSEDTAELYETETSEKLRRRFKDLYVRRIGIEPELRHELRPVLEGIKAGGRATVDEAIARLRTLYRNGFDFGAGGGNDSGRGDENSGTGGDDNSRAGA